MSKITLERGPWGDYTAYIDGVPFHTYGNGVKLDRAELLEDVLAKMGIEVETKWHYYSTQEVDGRERSVRIDRCETNMKV